jgi:hypothetical protein
MPVGSPPADPSGLLTPDVPVSGSQQLTGDPRQPRKHKVVRKPVSPSVPIGWEGSGATTTGYTEDRDLGSSNMGASNKGSSFALGNLVKERVAGRRKMSLTQQQQTLSPLQTDTEDETPMIRLSPAGLNSIDDWLDSREGLHKRSNTVSTVSTQHSRQSENLKLHIRKSTFAPLQPPQEYSPDDDEPIMPLIPARFLSKPTPAPPPPPPPPPVRTSSLRPREAPQPRGERELPARPPSPPASPEMPKEPEQPRGHIEQLEYEQAQHEACKKELRTEIYGIEQTLKTATMDRSLRERLKARLDELQQEYADAEKMVHDLGLKLYRAYRRRDKRDGVEGPTHLWVSRVTAPLDE